jgi:hypothetical protein
MTLGAPNRVRITSASAAACLRHARGMAGECETEFSAIRAVL